MKSELQHITGSLQRADKHCACLQMIDHLKQEPTEAELLKVRCKPRRASLVLAAPA